MTLFKRLAPLALLLAPASCQTMTPISGTEVSCLSFEPIQYSRTDTEETRRQIVAHNAAWDSLCKEPTNGGQPNRD